jgi:hypothetical protein
MLTLLASDTMGELDPSDGWPKQHSLSPLKVPFGGLGVVP